MTSKCKVIAIANQKGGGENNDNGKSWSGIGK